MAITLRLPAKSRSQDEGGLTSRSAFLATAKNAMAAFPAMANAFVKDFSFVPLIVFLVFVLSRPYRGIVQDANIYMGRALADLDPTGVGRDMMFVHDGQFGFSVFRFMADGLVWRFGPAAAAKTFAFAAALAWFFGALAFARQLTRGAAVWVALIFAALLPNTYGAPYPFAFAELIAIPRPFAEALVLAGLAALATQRDVVCLCCLATAALLHPIMALAGFGVLLAVRCFEDKRWLLLCAFGAALLVMAGALGAPFLNRLFTSIDPDLKGLHESRSPFLFPSLWPMESFPPLIVQTATIAIAASLRPGRARSILAAIVLAGLGGIAIATIFGDALSSLLLVQAQPWRMAWLMALVGAMAMGVCAVELWRRGENGRMVLALLTLCWAFNTQVTVAGPAALSALALHFGANRFAALAKPRYAFALWIFTIVVGTIWSIRLFAFPWEFALAAPAGYGNIGLVIIKGFLAFPLCALGAYFAIARPRIGPVVQGGCAVLLAAGFFFLWDHRTPAQRLTEENRAPPEIMRQIDRRHGEVLWIGGLAEAWFVLGRPQWASPLQGIPIIFSPALAAEWRSRMQILMDLGLADQKSFAPWSDPASADAPRLSVEGVRRLCAREDAPAWIIAPLEHGTTLPAGIDMQFWRLPEPLFQLAKGDGNYLWRRIDAYGVIPCAGQAHPLPN